ncbi:MAG TPA: serpin family protein [Bacillota bacterium]|nr:serpin family protein [Bacillota bacterium]
MKKVLLMLMMVIALFSMPALSKVEATARTITDEYYSSYVNFTIDTFQELATDSNIVYSPISLYYVLAMLASMSDGSAQEQLATVMGVDRETMLEQIQWLTNDILVDDEEGEYWFDNTLYFDNTFNLYDASYLQSYQHYFNYELADYDFADGSAGEALANKISEGTNHFLEMTPQDFDFIKDDNILFANSIYYKGLWSNKYNTSSTEEEYFYPETGDEYLTDFMYKNKSTLTYVAEDGVALKDRFKDGSTMIFILPDEDLSVNDIISSDEAMLRYIDSSNYSAMDVSIYLPKFEITARPAVKNMLIDLGLTSVFEPSTSTFPDLTEQAFALTDMMQVVKVMVDEEGATAAATTITVGCAAAAPLEPITFRANRPFIYMIMSSTDIPLFIGVNYNINNG